MKFKAHIFFLILITATACGKSKQECAEDSLIGEWDIVKLYESKNSLENGIVVSQEVMEFTEIEGYFTITASFMEYQYSTHSVVKVDQNYILNITKENAGFTRVDVYTIDGDLENFRVRFGDETSDAHENATEISLEQTVTSDTLVIDRRFDLVRK